MIKCALKINDTENRKGRQSSLERSLAVLQRCVLLALGIHKHSFSVQKKKEISWYVKMINPLAM